MSRANGRETAYLWGYVAGDGMVTADGLTITAPDERAAERLAAIAGTDAIDRRTTSRAYRHDPTITRTDESFLVRVPGTFDDAAARLGLPIETAEDRPDLSTDGPGDASADDRTDTSAGNRTGASADDRTDTSAGNRTGASANDRTDETASGVANPSDGDTSEEIIRDVTAGTASDPSHEVTFGFDRLTDHRRVLLRGLVESAGTICFKSSSGTVGLSFVHERRRLLRRTQELLAGLSVDAPTDAIDDASSGYWFGVADEAVPAVAGAIYDHSDETELYAPSRRRKLRRSLEQASEVTGRV